VWCNKGWRCIDIWWKCIDDCLRGSASYGEGHTHIEIHRLPHWSRQWRGCRPNYDTTILVVGICLDSTWLDCYIGSRVGNKDARNYPFTSEVLMGKDSPRGPYDDSEWYLE